MNPPLDSARLDLMVSGLWGRAEGVRTFIRSVAEASAPFLFGLVADHLFSHGSHGEALKWTFLLMLTVLALGGLVGLVALPTYPRDVATALKNDQRGHS